MSHIQAVLNEFMPCGTVCPGCEVACTSGDGRTPDVDRMADAILTLRAELTQAKLLKPTTGGPRMSEPRGVSVLRRKAVTQSEKLISVGSASENLRLHIIDAVEVLNAYDEQAAALTLASQRFEDCKDAHDYMEAALTDVLGGGFVSDHANRLAPDQYELVDRVRMMVIEHEEAVEELTQRAEAAESERDQWELSSTNWQADCRVAQSEREALRSIILWALGENGEFPDPSEGKPRRLYWWRNEMRSRLDAALAVQP